MNGTVYGVGVGRGDPELITVKAIRLIRENEVRRSYESGQGNAHEQQSGSLRCAELRDGERTGLPAY